MSDIATKLEYLNGTKQALKESINNLGGDITDETTFRQYANQLQNVYDNLPKTDYAEGSNITLSNTLKGKLDFEDGIVGIGDTSQKSYSGKNLYPSGTSTQTIAGITFTPQADGGIKLQGTSTYSNYYVAGGESNYVDVPNLSNLAEAVTLSVSGMQEGIQVYVVGRTLGAKGTSVSGSIGFTTIANDKYRLFIRVMADSTVNTTLYIQLEKGNSATSFEKYVGGAQSPSPSYPQEVEVVRGKNLFDKNSVTTGYYYNLNGTLMTSNNWNVEQVEVQPNTNYYLSGNNYNNEIAGIVLLDKDKNYISLVSSYKNVHLITTTATTKYIGLSIANYSDNSDMNTIQLEKGSQATSYLPYNTIEEVVRGKNILPFKFNSQELNGVTLTAYDDGTIKLNGTSTANTVFGGTSLPTYTFEKGTYTYSIENALVGGANISIYYGTNSVLKSLGTSTTGDFEITKDTTYQWFRLSLYIPSGQTYDNVILKPMIRKASITDSTYEPYQTPQTYQLSLGDKEPAKTDIADEFIYDIDNDKVYLDKNTRKVVFNGTETWTMTQTAVGYRFRIDLSGIKASASAAAIPKLYCDKLIANSLDNIWTIGGNCMGLFSGFGGVVVICLADLSIDTIDKFKTWLASNNLTAYLPLAETSREEITGTLKDQIKALYNLQSFTGTTIIEIDGQLPLIIKVRALKGE